MALITCPDCQKEVSDAAPACPSCGRPRTEVAVKKVGSGVGKLAGLTVLVVGLFGTCVGAATSGTGGLLLGLLLVVAGLYLTWSAEGRL